MRTIITLAALIFAASFPSPAHAKNPAGWFFAPYVGADFERWKLDYDDQEINGITIDPGAIYDDKFNYYNFHAGARVHRHLGFELGYGFSSEESKSIGRERIEGAEASAEATYRTELDFKGWNFDLMGYLPLDEEERFDLIATAGVARIKAKVTFPADVKIKTSDGSSVAGTAILGRGSETEIGWRAGGGFQYRLIENLSARVLVRYADFGGDFDFSLWTMGVGLNFHF